MICKQCGAKLLMSEANDKTALCGPCRKKGGVRPESRVIPDSQTRSVAGALRRILRLGDPHR